LPTIKGVKPMLQSAFQNVLDNAVKFTRRAKDPKVTVSAHNIGGGMWEISIKDNGIGISSDFLGQVFEPFSKQDMEKGGSGIGLSLVKNVAERHKGKVLVHSNGLGEGTIFRIILPADL